jgi:hypothetical protein
MDRSWWSKSNRKHSGGVLFLCISFPRFLHNLYSEASAYKYNSVKACHLPFVGVYRSYMSYTQSSAQMFCLAWLAMNYIEHWGSTFSMCLQSVCATLTKPWILDEIKIGKNSCRTIDAPAKNLKRGKGWHDQKPDIKRGSSCTWIIEKYSSPLTTFYQNSLSYETLFTGHHQSTTTYEPPSSCYSPGGDNKGNYTTQNIFI